MNDKPKLAPKRGAAGFSYVSQHLSEFGYKVTNSTFHRLEIQKGESEPIRVAIKNWSVSKNDSQISKVDDLYSADAYILIRSDNPNVLKAYVYLADEIGEAQHPSLTPPSFPFTVDIGKNLGTAGYWSRSGWLFCENEDRKEAWHLIRKANPSLAIDDLEQDDVGNDDPEYRKRMAGSYVRDRRVREQVLKRADGICEECGQLGFQTRGGKPYLETHHVIALSEQGPDRPHNVIALCATDHRRAHFADNWKELQDTFLAKLNKYKSEN